MPQALYFKASYERLKERIDAVAPDLEIALYEEGRFFLKGKEVALAELSPEYFWIHSELMVAKQVKEYFAIIQDSATARWLHTLHTGLDILPYKTLFDAGMSLSNNHSQAIAIAEFVMGQLLSHIQNIPGYRQMQEEKKWQYRPFAEIKGSHWLLIGFGHIGQEVARRAKAFGVNITAVRRSSKTEGLADQVVRLDRLEQVLPEADVVLLACASNAATQSLVNSDFLALMKEGSVLVNVARGDLVVETDLKEALDRGLPSKAILDVFNEEPLPRDSWIWNHPRLSLTPHCSNAGSGMRTRSDDLFIENLTRMVQGDELLNKVSLTHF